MGKNGEVAASETSCQPAFFALCAKKAGATSRRGKFARGCAFFCCPRIVRTYDSPAFRLRLSRSSVRSPNRNSAGTRSHRENPLRDGRCREIGFFVAGPLRLFSMLRGKGACLRRFIGNTPSSCRCCRLCGIWPVVSMPTHGCFTGFQTILRSFIRFTRFRSGTAAAGPLRRRIRF